MAVASGVLLGVFEGVGVLLNRVFSEGTRQQAPACAFLSRYQFFAGSLTIAPYISSAGRSPTCTVSISILYTRTCSLDGHASTVYLPAIIALMLSPFAQPRSYVNIIRSLRYPSRLLRVAQACIASKAYGCCKVRWCPFTARLHIC